MKTCILFFITLIMSTMANASTATTGSQKYNAYAQELMLKRFDSVKGDIFEASVTTGINMSELVAIGSLESKLKTVAQPKRGSAKGILQYTDRTWKSKRKRYADELGLASNAHQNNLRANLLIGSKDLQDTKQKLIERTHLTEQTLTLGDVYLAHFLGEDGAVKVINSYSHKPVNQIVAIHPGNSYYNKPNGQFRTAREMRQHMNLLVKEEIKVYQDAILEYQIRRAFGPVHDIIDALKESRTYVAMIPQRFVS